MPQSHLFASEPKLIGSKLPFCQLLGTVLEQADLVSGAQIKIALLDQSQRNQLRIGEILALRGWLKPETADFFVEQWPTLLEQEPQQPLGYYLKKAALLDGEQINQILAEQGKIGWRFGELAVLKGWLKPTTLYFFLKHLLPEYQSDSLWLGRQELLTSRQGQRSQKKLTQVIASDFTKEELRKEDLDSVKMIIGEINSID